MAVWHHDTDTYVMHARMRFTVLELNECATCTDILVPLLIQSRYRRLGQIFRLLSVLRIL